MEISILHAQTCIHSLTHSLLGYGCPLPEVLRGQERRGQLSPLICAFVFTSPAQEDPAREARAQLPREGMGRRQASAVLMAGGNAAAPPPWGRGSSCLSEGRGRQVKRISGQALPQGCHPAALPSNTRPGSKPPPYSKTDQAEIFVALGGLLDYQSQSCDAETPPLPSTCT